MPPFNNTPLRLSKTTQLILLTHVSSYLISLLRGSSTHILSQAWTPTNNNMITKTSSHQCVQQSRKKHLYCHGFSSFLDASNNEASPPYLALITEATACDSEENLAKTVAALEKAAVLSTEPVALVSVRINKVPPAVSAADEESDQRQQRQQYDRESRVLRLLQLLMEWSASLTRRKDSSPFRVVVSSDWYPLLRAQISPSKETAAAPRRYSSALVLPHGIHVKESHRHLIPEIREFYDKHSSSSSNNKRSNVLIGTSAHSINSAVSAFETYQPDYLFVGTCYPTLSHPEKQLEDMEGPELPGQVCLALNDLLVCKDKEERWTNSTNLKQQTSGDINNNNNENNIAQLPPPSRQQRPTVFAIGGINASNCGDPVVRYGADGVATIRAVLQASDPAHAVRQMRRNMVV